MRQNDKKIEELTMLLQNHIKTEFSKRELEYFFAEMKDTLDRIEKQVISTNTRVTLLEFWKENLMARIATVFAVMGILWVLIKEYFSHK